MQQLRHTNYKGYIYRLKRFILNSLQNVILRSQMNLEGVFIKLIKIYEAFPASANFLAWLYLQLILAFNEVKIPHSIYLPSILQYKIMDYLLDEGPYLMKENKLKIITLLEICLTKSNLHVWLMKKLNSLKFYMLSDKIDNNPSSVIDPFYIQKLRGLICLIKEIKPCLMHEIRCQESTSNNMIPEKQEICRLFIYIWNKLLD